MKRIVGRIVIAFEDVDIEVENGISNTSIINEMFPDGYEGCINNIDISGANISED